MKTCIAIILLFCAHSIYSQSPTPDIQKLKWLEGAWERTNAKPGRSGSETWTRITDVEWRGTGVAMKGSDTSFVERIRIIEKDGAVFYVADVPENKSEVYFRFTALTSTGFVCENPQHDFPKKITYMLDGDRLIATISGDGKQIEYRFVKR